MCSFFSTQIFFHPRLKDVTYYMRVDTDSLFTAPLCYDPIEVIHRRQRLYGYVFIGSEPQWVTSGMWSLVQNYTDAHPSVDKRLGLNNWRWSHRDENGDESLDFFGYGTNLEIVNLDAFRRPDIREWLDAIERYPEGIYKWRWGERKHFFRQITLFTFFFCFFFFTRRRAPAIRHCTNVPRRRKRYRIPLRHPVYPPLERTRTLSVRATGSNGRAARELSRGALTPPPHILCVNS